MTTEAKSTDNDSSSIDNQKVQIAWNYTKVSS
jgi:hypothetical protein